MVGIDSIKEHAEKYNLDAWKEYDLVELGMWVSLLVKRSYMRADPQKKEKDLLDAQNYLYMMQEHINWAKQGK